jgi:hypothetical protein
MTRSILIILFIFNSLVINSSVFSQTIKDCEGKVGAEVSKCLKKIKPVTSDVNVPKFAVDPGVYSKPVVKNKILFSEILNSLDKKMQRRYQKVVNKTCKCKGKSEFDSKCLKEVDRIMVGESIESFSNTCLTGDTNSSAACVKKYGVELVKCLKKQKKKKRTYPGLIITSPGDISSRNYSPPRVTNLKFQDIEKGMNKKLTIEFEKIKTQYCSCELFPNSEAQNGCANEAVSLSSLPEEKIKKYYGVSICEPNKVYDEDFYTSCLKSKTKSVYNCQEIVYDRLKALYCSDNKSSSCPDNLIELVRGFGIKKISDDCLEVAEQGTDQFETCQRVASGQYLIQKYHTNIFNEFCPVIWSNCSNPNDLTCKRKRACDNDSLSKLKVAEIGTECSTKFKTAKDYNSCLNIRYGVRHQFSEADKLALNECIEKLPKDITLEQRVNKLSRCYKRNEPGLNIDRMLADLEEKYCNPENFKGTKEECRQFLLQASMLSVGADCDDKPDEAARKKCMIENAFANLGDNSFPIMSCYMKDKYPSYKDTEKCLTDSKKIQELVAQCFETKKDPESFTSCLNQARALNLELFEEYIASLSRWNNLDQKMSVCNKFSPNEFQVDQCKYEVLAAVNAFGNKAPLEGIFAQCTEYGYEVCKATLENRMQSDSPTALALSGETPSKTAGGDSPLGSDLITNGLNGDTPESSEGSLLSAVGDQGASSGEDIASNLDLSDEGPDRSNFIGRILSDFQRLKYKRSTNQACQSMGKAAQIRLLGDLGAVTTVAVSASMAQKEIQRRKDEREEGSGDTQVDSFKVMMSYVGKGLIPSAGIKLAAHKLAKVHSNNALKFASLDQSSLIKSCQSELVKTSLFLDDVSPLVKEMEKYSYAYEENIQKDLEELAGYSEIEIDKSLQSKILQSFMLTRNLLSLGTAYAVEENMTSHLGKMIGAEDDKAAKQLYKDFSESDVKTPVIVEANEDVINTEVGIDDALKQLEKAKSIMTMLKGVNDKLKSENNQ